MKILGISGSLRADSHNTKLLRVAAELLPGEVDFELCQGLKAVPPYDEDDDIDPAPAAVAALREVIADADAVLAAASLEPAALEARRRRRREHRGVRRRLVPGGAP